MYSTQVDTEHVGLEGVLQEAGDVDVEKAGGHDAAFLNNVQCIRDEKAKRT